MLPPLTFLAVSGSLRAASSNTALLRLAAGLLPADATMTLFQGLDALPHFNPDRESEPFPAVQAWRAALKQADAVVISSPEYAHGVPGVLKNALDWVVGSGELVDKPVGILDTTPLRDGGSHAHASLIETLTVMSARVVPQATVRLGGVRGKLAEDGRLHGQDLAAQLTMALQALVKAVPRS